MFKQIRAFLLILLGSMALWPHLAEAADLIVPDQYATIASALIAAANTSEADTIVLRRGTYSGPVTLLDNVSLRGDETARTIIDGGGADAVITAKNGSTIQRLTIRNGKIGIAVLGTATQIRNVKNNIIINNTSGIECTGADTIAISYNTFNNNGTAITCTSSTRVTITNNIISNNTTSDITFDQPTAVDYNLFFNNGTENYVETQLRNQDLNQTHNIFTPKVGNANPDFVDPNNNDFHLRAGSPAIGAADDNGEIGVYGGGNNDPPFPVSNLRVTPGSDTITVEWSQNLAHNIQGYKVYYDSDEANPPYQPPLDVGNVVTSQITGLSTSVTEEIPQNLRIGIGDTELLLMWSPITRASVVGYRIYYGTTSGTYGSPIEVDTQAVPPYKLTNLTNNTTYFIAISTIAKPVYFVTVTAIDDQSLESDFAPVQKTALTVSELESQKSSEANEYPEETGRFPNISNEGGCFIATAAYGSPLEPHVQTLRAFRDRYLLTNMPGRKFVAFYYRTSPPLAQWLEEHTSFKPVVRAILSPIVFITDLWMNAEPLGQLLMIVLFFPLAGFSIYRWGILRWGGHH